MNIDVTIFTTEDELNCEVYTFWFDDSRSLIKLNNFYIQSRATKRHHFRSSKVWSKLDGRRNNIERPVVSDEIKAMAMKSLLNHIKFEAG
mgnify:CR=1 FL=1